MRCRCRRPSCAEYSVALNVCRCEAFADSLLPPTQSDDNASVASNEPAKDAAASRSSSSRPSGSSHHRSHSTSSTSNRQRDSRHPSRAGSPSGSALVAKRATSPTGSASGKKSRGSSPAPSSGGGKRKRPDGTDGGESDGGKRRKNASPAPGEVAGLITEGDLVALFKTKEGYSITTQEVLSHFKSQLRREPQNRALISSLLRNVANLVDGKLVLKSGL